MRELHLNGYIDEEVWFGDEITPDSLHEALYGAESQFADDVHIRLNSFGGSCNAAARMYDDVRAYPGNVHITVSGTAASAATVLAMAADRLEMTPGSLWMVHDPSVIALGNERDLAEAIGLLRACKESILNIYAIRCKKDRRRTGRHDVGDIVDGRHGGARGGLHRWDRGGRSGFRSGQRRTDPPHGSRGSGVQGQSVAGSTQTTAAPP